MQMTQTSLSASPACRPGPCRPELHPRMQPLSCMPRIHYGYAAGAKKGMNVWQGAGCNLLVCSCLSTSPPCDVPWPTPILHCPVLTRHHFIRRLQGRLPPLELPSASAHANTASFHENTRTVVAIRSAAKPVNHVFCVYVK